MHHKKLSLDARFTYILRQKNGWSWKQHRGKICMGNYKNVNNINGHETFINDWRVCPLKWGAAAAPSQSSAHFPLLVFTAASTYHLWKPIQPWNIIICVSTRPNDKNAGSGWVAQNLAPLLMLLRFCWCSSRNISQV